MESKRRLLIIRTDTNVHIGTGHLMRCLALAQAWQSQGGEAVFVTDGISDGLLQRLSDESFQVSTLERPYPDAADWRLTSEVLAAHPDAWVVLDGYHFDPSYQLRIKEVGHPLLVIDDMGHLDHYYADVVLNQNIHAGQLDYSCEPYTRLLVGTRYALLRREFWPWREWQREIPLEARKVLVTLGGADPYNQTLKVICALREVEIDGLESTVVVGSNNPHFLELESKACDLPGVRLVRNSSNIPELMAWAEMAISAAGSTCWELAYMGLPSLLIATADNQRLVAEGVAGSGVAENLGWHEDVDVKKICKGLESLLSAPEKRQSMSKSGRNLVDGVGASRTIEIMRASDIILRPVQNDDCKLLWEWANESEVRAASFSSEPIPWDQHVHWFNSKISEENCIFYVALDDEGTPVGQVRFDRESNEAVISVTVDNKYRGLGIGSLLIRKASQRLFDATKISKIHAYVKRDNDASKRAFVSAGYKERYQLVMHGHPALQLTFTKTTENESFI